jgi:hypothetical protein
MKKFYNLILLFLIIIFASCKPSGPNLNGTWEDKFGTTLIITKEGDNYFLKHIYEGGQDSYSGKFVDGQIQIGEGLMGNPVYSNEKDKLFWAGEEFTRKSN